MEINPSGENQPRKFTEGVAKKQYFTAGFYLDADILETLSYQSDEMSRRFGDQTIVTMMRDPEIKKCYTVVKINVLAEGVSFFPALSKPPIMPQPLAGEKETAEQKKRRTELDEETKRYEEAKEYSDFMNRSLMYLEKPFLTTLEGMLQAFLYGNKIAEKVYDTFYDPIFNKEILAVKKFKVKSRDSVAFVVDSYNDVRGIKGFTFENKVKKTIILPREKFFVFTFDEVDDDPRGQSQLEAVYNAWFLKTKVFPEYLKWLETCAIPGLIGEMPPNVESRQVLDRVTLEPVFDANNNPVYQDDASIMLQQLVLMKNSSVMVIPNGAKVTPLTNTVSGDPFRGIIDVLNEEMEMGLLLQTLATSDSRNNTRAASQTHISVMDTYIYWIKERLADAILFDYVRQMMELNFPGYDRSLTPKVSLGDSNRREWATDANAVANLFKSGYLHSSQLVYTDAMLSLIERDLKFDRPGTEQQPSGERKPDSGSQINNSGDNNAN